MYTYFIMKHHHCAPEHKKQNISNMPNDKFPVWKVLVVSTHVYLWLCIHAQLEHIIHTWIGFCMLSNKELWTAHIILCLLSFFFTYRFMFCNMPYNQYKTKHTQVTIRVSVLGSSWHVHGCQKYIFT